MNRTARIQTWAGVATVAALPALYLGATNELVPVTALGLVVFTAGMLVTPALRFLPGPKEAPVPPLAAGGSQSADGPAERGAEQAGEEPPASTRPAPQPHEE